MLVILFKVHFYTQSCSHLCYKFEKIIDFTTVTKFLLTVMSLMYTKMHTNPMGMQMSSFSLG